ncbi:hypothetical protein B0T16DRAFT_243209 [Cercophora newfieldiana]|uniref:Heterokaryon incompatibility domain-containing protein n=1 Tax=Cercophora newfieldiana TaxID=92897 RepID=A0AA39XSE6_9PEZI|nr:hypothetical protein B0T16DRAFT_243209 [Cercophora newfieldiana]
MGRKKAFSGCMVTARLTANPFIFGTQPGGIDPFSKPVDLPNLKTLVRQRNFSDVDLGRNTQLKRREPYHPDSRMWTAQSGMGELDLRFRNVGGLGGLVVSIVFIVTPPQWCNMPRAQVGQPVANSDMARTWLAQCQEHEGCKGTWELSYTPTRLLDLGEPSDDLTVRLVETQRTPIKGGGYVALSHCWGPPHLRPTRTTKALLPEFLKGIPFESLPLSFKDAIKFCRKLGFRYLWINSLYIIQDNHND